MINLSNNTTLLNSLCSTLNNTLHINNLVTGISTPVALGVFLLNTFDLLIFSPKVLLSPCNSLDPRRKDTTFDFVGPGFRFFLAGRFDTASGCFLDDEGGTVKEDVCQNSGDETVCDTVGFF